MKLYLRLAAKVSWCPEERIPCAVCGQEFMVVPSKIMGVLSNDPTSRDFKQIRGYLCRSCALENSEVLVATLAKQRSMQEDVEIAPLQSEDQQRLLKTDLMTKAEIETLEAEAASLW